MTRSFCFGAWLKANLASLLLIISSSVWAAPVFSVYGVQYPAWVESNGERAALSPGARIDAGQKVVTGTAGKVWLTMADGARVKLGESTKLDARAAEVSLPSTVQVTQGSEQAAQTDSVINAAFDVLEGAFRYTSDKLSGAWQRDIRIGLGATATIGIRGTDLWGRVDSAEAFVVLLEGVIDVANEGDSDKKTLSQPLAIFKASDASVSSVDLPAVQALAPETELDVGHGVQFEDGHFVVHLASFSDEAQARRQQKALSVAGLHTQVSTSSVGDQLWYRVSTGGLASVDDARALVVRVKDDFSLVSPWMANQ